MAHRFLGSFVTEPHLTASVHRVGDVTIEIALVPATIRTIQVFVHRQSPGDGQIPLGRWFTNADLARPGTGYSLHAINIPPCLAIDTSREVAVLRLADQEQVEDALPEPEQEGALKGLVGEAVPCDPGIGGLGPLPDAGPDEVEVVEGVGSKTETKRPLEIPGIGPESEIEILSAQTVVRLLLPGVDDVVELELDLGGKTRICRDTGQSIPLLTPHYNFLTVLADALRHLLRATLRSEEE